MGYSSVWRVENQKAQEGRFTGKQDFERLHFELKLKKKYDETCFLWIIQQASALVMGRDDREEGSHLIRDIRNHRSVCEYIICGEKASDCLERGHSQSERK